MKKILLSAILMYFINISLAQTNNALPTGVQVTPEGIITPVIVSNKFNMDYPNNNAIWQKEGDNYAAEFTDESTNTKYFIVYDEDGNLVRKDKEIDNTAYPKGIATYYSKNYPDENYVVWLSEDNKGNKTYYTKRKLTTICFDKNGRYVAVKK